jgi:hypothetical protein
MRTTGAGGTDVSLEGEEATIARTILEIAIGGGRGRGRGRPIGIATGGRATTTTGANATAARAGAVGARTIAVIAAAIATGGTIEAKAATTAVAPVAVPKIASNS